MNHSMKTANTNTSPSWVGLSLNEAMKVQTQSRLSAGSCNACTNGQYLTDKSGEDVVTEVMLRGLTFRLCNSCKKNLKGLL